MVVETRLWCGAMACWLFLFPISALAQHPATVGDLLDKGGKKLAKDEVTQLVSGATVSGASFNDPQTTRVYTYRDNGSISGHSIVAMVPSSSRPVAGKWAISDQGQICVDRESSRTGKTDHYCGFYFVLNNSYYEAGTDARSASIFSREIKR